MIADGSSTVGPLTTAAAEAYREEQSGVNVEVGISGTGGGFERFCAGETDISDASRPIKDDEEAPLCADAGITYVDYTVAIDALTVIVNTENDWVTCLTVEQLMKIWEPAAEGKITNWNQVDPSFPDEPLDARRPGHRLRYVRLLHRRRSTARRARAAPTTTPARTTTSSCRRSQARRVRWATSATRTTRRTRTR